MITLNDATFKTEVLESDVPVLVDFWASWCRPCNVLTPVLEKVAGECPDCKVGKINIDENQETPKNYSVGSIPTLIFFKGGKEVKRMIGLQDAQTIAQALQGLK